MGGSTSEKSAKKRAKTALTVSDTALTVSDTEMKDTELSLYLVTMEIIGDGAYYRLQALKLRDLLSFSVTPIMKHVYYLEGSDVPMLMGATVFNSRIVLAGGLVKPTIDPSPAFVLKTESRVGEYPTVKCIRKTAIPAFPIQTRSPWMQEINGKLYALSRSANISAPFQVYDPQTHIWHPLPHLPFHEVTRNLFASYCFVVGNKIFVTLMCKDRSVKILFFDVSHSEKSWSNLQIPPDQLDFNYWNCGYAHSYNKTLVLDSKNDHLEKLLFTSTDNLDDVGGRIVVYHMTLSREGQPELIKQIHIIDVLLGEEYPMDYSCKHLGGQTVCFSFMFGLNLLVFVFEFSYSDGLFSVKRTARHVFEYHSKFADLLKYEKPVCTFYKLLDCLLL